MAKANFKGADQNVYPSPKAKSSPGEKVDFSNPDYPSIKGGSPLDGAGGDSRARVDDDRPGATRWKMNEGEALKNMNSGKSRVSYGPGPNKG